MMPEKPVIPVILGPTAIGKTAIGIKVCEKLNGEIISADSRQIYRQMNIGTAKPTQDELSRRRHHLIDFLDPKEVFSAGDFVRAAVNAIQDITARGKLPVIVGGAGLYIKALTEGIFEGDSSNPDVRRRLEEEYDSGRSEELYDRLKRIDPVYSEIVHPNDRKKLVRALEIYEVTGLTVSELNEHQPSGKIEGIMCGLTMPRESLYRRIEERVDKMLADGLVEEVKLLKENGLTEEDNSMKSPGYKEVLNYLDGALHHDEMTKLIKQNTRRYAKRQITWFKNTPNVKWFDVGEGGEKTVDDILKEIHSKIK